MKKILIKISLLVLLSLCINCTGDDEAINVPQPTGAVLSPEVGGPASPNQIWIDLDTNTMKISRRDSWDLGFYCGNEFKVILNNSVMIAAAKLNSINIDQVSEAYVSALKPLVAVGTFNPENIKYVDNVKGNFLKYTAIGEISDVEDENFVYLLNMGYSIYEGDFSPGTVYNTGNSRGWKKIRILRNGKNGYRVQYADISDTMHKEYIIPKQSDFLFTFFSIEKGITDIQPEKNNWDICFTVFTNEIKGYGTYIYPDFVTTNIYNKTGVYRALTSEVGDYNTFSRKDVNHTQFVYDDQRAIGADWRQTYNGATVYSDRFYIIKDYLGTLYKLRFLKLTDNDNYRGYPQFEYDVL